MWYWIIGLLAGLYVFFDARKRGNNPWGWSIPTVIAFFLVIPIYWSKRYLLEGEKREGGTAWNLLKSFVIVWSIFCLAWLIAYFVRIGGMEVSSEAEAAGAAVGGTLGTVTILFIWLAIAAIAGILGLFLKKSVIVEGPTGPRKLKQREAGNKEVVQVSTKPQINLNKANKEKLMELPGIGPKIADEIIKYRKQNPFKRVEEIKQITGISINKFRELKNRITIEEGSEDETISSYNEEEKIELKEESKKDIFKYLEKYPGGSMIADLKKATGIEEKELKMIVDQMVEKGEVKYENGIIKRVNKN